MILSQAQTLLLIALMAGGTILTRFLPFILFPAQRRTPSYVIYLGQVLPAAVIGLLVIYCLKDVSITATPFGLPEWLAIILVILLQRWKKNALLSIGAGTALYMLLLQLFF